MAIFDHLTTAILKFWPWSWSNIFDHLTMTPGRRPNGQKIVVILPPQICSRLNSEILIARRICLDSDSVLFQCHRLFIDSQTVGILQTDHHPCFLTVFRLMSHHFPLSLDLNVSLLPAIFRFKCLTTFHYL